MPLPLYAKDFMPSKRKVKSLRVATGNIEKNQGILESQQISYTIVEPDPTKKSFTIDKKTDWWRITPVC